MVIIQPFEFEKTTVIIQPFEYEKTTAFKERVEIVNKVNEIVDCMNKGETTKIIDMGGFYKLFYSTGDKE